MQSNDELRKKLHAAVLFAIVTAEFAYIQRNSWQLGMTAIGTVCAAFLWRKWLAQRAVVNPGLVRSFAQIAALERRQIANSLFLLSPLLAFCTITLGYLQRGYAGAIAGLFAGVVYLLFIWAVHRYPVS